MCSNRNYITLCKFLPLQVPNGHKGEGQEGGGPVSAGIGPIPTTTLRLCCILIIAALLLAVGAPVAAAPVPARFEEGMEHGFLLLKTTTGKVIASGDHLQSTKNNEVTSRTVFHFKDGSLFDERVTFTQKNEFTLQSYRLVQKGPTFKVEMEVSLERGSGKCRVTTKDSNGGEDKIWEEKLDLPPDLYNGMIPVIIKNLRKGAGDTVHMLTFMPAPKMIELEIMPSGKNEVVVGGGEKSAVRYVLKAKLGLALKFLAKIAGRMPPDNHAWVLSSEVPAFVKFEGQLYFNGPVWRIELTSPHSSGGESNGSN